MKETSTWTLLLFALEATALLACLFSSRFAWWLGVLLCKHAEAKQAAQRAYRDFFKRTMEPEEIDHYPDMIWPPPPHSSYPPAQTDARLSLVASVKEQGS